jgi:uncharacterized membrane protein (UPF0182 family)
VRIPSDLPADPSPPRRRHRARWWIAGLAVLLIILLISLRSLANIYTDSLWFSSVNFHNVFSTLLVIKLGLFGVFGAIFFAVLWVNLVVCDRIAGRDIVLAQEDELVRRYQHYVRPYSGRIYVAIAFVLALIGASGTISQWNNWILFRHGGNFGVTDPQFHKDIGFYVFKLPFLIFCVDWTLAILIVTLGVTLVFHYLNGGIQPQRGLPRVRPPVKAHISVLLALIALDKAVGYIFQRWSMVNASDGYVNGAGYTDVHARLPAELLLVYVSIGAALILLYNIRRQGWTLPVLAVGIWAFVALVVGIIYPALLQALKVNPAQSSLEAPYIQRNITATRAAYGLKHVTVHSFPASTTITPSQTVLNARTIYNIRQWDPDPTISLETFQRIEGIKSYYAFPSLGVDRYVLGGVYNPVLIGVREISPSGVPSQTWVNTHLQYTHGNAAAVAPANQTSNTTNANPVFGVSGIPPVSSQGLPKITQPNVYFGLGESGYVVANTKQAEVDYQQSNGNNIESHYSQNGGVQLSNFFSRAAFALRLGDFNLLISSQITDKSRIMFVRDPLAMAQKAAPFLSFDHDPYAVIYKGQIDWILDGYTTTSNYAYSQNAGSQQVAIGSTLPSNYNYVRNSVKVVVNAYTGQMTFYDIDPSDPILQAYSAAFPHMFVPIRDMPAKLQAHLRYPEDIFSIQSAIYGRYHLKNPQQFYAASNAWQLSPTAGAGPQSQALLAQNTYNNQGQLISTTPARMSPQYQVYSLPGTDPTNPNNQLFTVSDGFVPATQSSGTSSSTQNFNLTAWMVGMSDPTNYGQLNLYQVPQGTVGPANADAEIQADNNVSSAITLLNQHGSQVLLGETLMVPIADSMVYIRPLYVAASSNPQPKLEYVVAVLGGTVAFDTSLSAVMSDITHVALPSSSTGGSSTGTVPAALSSILAAAQTDYDNAQAALKAQNLSQYQTDIAAMEQQLASAQDVLNATTGGTTTTTTTTTIPKIPAKGKKTSGTTSTTTSSTTTTSTAPTSTEPRGGPTTTSTSASAAGVVSGGH